MDHPTPDPTDQLSRVARRHLAIEDVHVRDMRQTRRFELALWQIREALHAAYEAGHQAASAPPSSP